MGDQSDSSLLSYQVYAYLKRLGYTLVRARPIPGVERPPPDRPFSLYYATRDALSLPLITIRDSLLRFIQSLRAFVTSTLAKNVRLIATRTVGSREGKFASLVSGRRWANYGGLSLLFFFFAILSISYSLYSRSIDQLFSRLQIIPTGHDTPLPRSALPQTPSLLTPLIPSPHPSHTLPPASTSTEPLKELQDLEQYPYQPFFHMYKPVTKYKKSNPPPPDFRIVVVK